MSKGANCRYLKKAEQIISTKKSPANMCMAALLLGC